MPEMAQAGVNVTIGIDGNNASNYGDLMRATYLVAGLFKDARRDPTMFPAEQAFEMATLGGARALLASDEIGSIEVGKRADLVLHDRDRPEWTPLPNIANQLVWSEDGRSVHTVFVDGRKVVIPYRLTRIDAKRLYGCAWRGPGRSGPPPPWRRWDRIHLGRAAGAPGCPRWRPARCGPAPQHPQPCPVGIGRPQGPHRVR